MKTLAQDLWRLSAETLSAQAKIAEFDKLRDTVEPRAKKSPPKPRVSPFADSEKMTLCEPGGETAQYLADSYERKTYTGD